jgi:hypothetical protein
LRAPAGRNVRGGRRGLRENGEKVFVEAGYSAMQKETRQRVIVKSQQHVARIPADDRMIKMVDGNPVGVILLERKSQRRGHDVPCDCPHPTNPTGSL